MMQVTQKELRNMAGKPYCEDITYGKEKDYQRIMKEEGWLDTVAYSTGMYGRSGTLYRGHNTGKMYVITSRTSAIYLFP